MLVTRSGELGGRITVPGSKSETHRSLELAALADGRSTLLNCLESEDTLSTLEALRLFGIKIDREDDRTVVEGSAGSLSSPPGPIDLGNSGTSLRFLTTLAGLARGRVILTGDESLRSRPMTPLMECLGTIGVEARSVGESGTAPIEVHGRGSIDGGEGSVSGSVSSQFISSLLIPSPYFERGLRLSIVGDLISAPYVDLTVEMMASFGVEVVIDKGTYCVGPGPGYRAGKFRVGGDYSSAAFPMSAAAITGSCIEVDGLREGSHQADEAFLGILERMGCSVERVGETVRVEGGELTGIDVDLSDSPDLLPPVSVVASLASGPSVISGVEHARLKESDRIESIFRELRRIGIRVEQRIDGLSFQGDGRPRGKEVFSRGDHRLAMALAVLGLATDGLVVRGASCFDVSYPDFYRDMVALGARFAWVQV
jgi:3-phosphoshikimate 1-carboxyvinyltransferase